MKPAATTRARLAPDAICIDDVTLIPLTQGEVAIIDTADAPLIVGHKWSVMRRRGGIMYAQASVGGALVTMHRLLLGFPSISVDHRNQDGLDNRRCNIRLATNLQNLCNRGPQKNNTTGFKGVQFHRRTGRYKAQITAHRRVIHLGYFPTPEDAARAYDWAARELHGDFAWLNFK